MLPEFYSCINLPWFIGGTDSFYPTPARIVDTLQLSSLLKSALHSPELGSTWIGHQKFHYIPCPKDFIWIWHAHPVCLSWECCGGSHQVHMHTEACKCWRFQVQLQNPSGKEACSVRYLSEITSSGWNGYKEYGSSESGLQTSASATHSPRAHYLMRGPCVASLLSERLLRFSNLLDILLYAKDINRKEIHCFIIVQIVHCQNDCYIF